MARKKGTSSGDYEGWLLRSIENPEDLFFASQSTAWLRFIGNKSYDFNKVPISKGQQAAIASMRDQVFEFTKNFAVPIRYEVVTQYRDSRGHFAKANTPGAKPVGQVQRFSEVKTGKRTSYNRFQEELGSYKVQRLAQLKQETKRHREGKS